MNRRPRPGDSPLKHKITRVSLCFRDLVVIPSGRQTAVSTSVMSLSLHRIPFILYPLSRDSFNESVSVRLEMEIES